MEFFPEHIKMLQSQGHSVEFACHMQNPFSDKISALRCKVHEIPFSRNPLNVSNFKAYKKLEKLIKNEKYDLIHTHTPNASVCARLAVRKLRKKGLKVIYTAHGFHFYKGAPLKNWLLYYPLEKLCSRWTDTLITINREDYELAKNKMHAKRVCYVPGVGIDIGKFVNTVVDRDKKRIELGIPQEAILLLSVGELNKNKNHETIIKALARLNRKDIHYAIAGEGDLKNHLKKISYDLSISEQVHILGFRKDIAELYKVADICCFPSIREGLGLAALEGMSCGLPLIASSNRGAKDYAVNNENAYLCSPMNVECFVEAIKILADNYEMRRIMSKKNFKIVEKFDTKNILRQMTEIYNNIFD